MTDAGPLLVGVDIGTTRVKAGVVDCDGVELSHAAVPTVWQRLGDGGAEAQPADFATAVRTVIARALAEAPPGPVAGVGVASIAETLVLIDRAGVPVSPAVAWYDQRAAGDLQQLLEEFPDGEYGRRTGLGAVQLPSVATLRHQWNAGGPARRTRWALSVAEWIVHDLGGTVAAEPSLASRTGALDIDRCDWWTDAVEWAGVPADVFPPLRPAGTSWGRMTDASPELDRVRGATLTVAGHDHLVAAVGCGVTATDQAMDSCGTAEAIVRAVPVGAARELAGRPDSRISVGWHVLEGTHALLAGLRLGIDLVPVLQELGLSSRHGLSPLDTAALELLAGELTGDTSTARRWLEAVDGTVVAWRAAMDEIETVDGPLREIRVSGGWAGNPVLATLKARATGLPLTRPSVTEAGVRGAALLAGRAAGLLEPTGALPDPPLLASPSSACTPAV